MESSRYWNSNDVGDGAAAGYARALIASWLSKVFARGGSGILARVLNELVVTGTSSPLAVASGAAIVDGLFYENDASLNLTVTTPGTGTTGGRVILRADWSAQTVRAVILLNTDGVAAIPALTQTPGTTYEINVASFTITTGGTIGNLVLEPGRVSFSDSPQAGSLNLAGVSVLGRSANSAGAGEAIAAASDGQVLRRSGTSIGFGQIGTLGIADGAVAAGNLDIADETFDTADIANDAVDDTKAGDRLPQFYRRQGGSATDWNTAGSSNYTPGAVILMGGAVEIEVPSDTNYATVSVTLPVSLSKPILLATIFYTTITYSTHFAAYVEAVSDSAIEITIYMDKELAVNTFRVHWLAMGPG